MECDLTVSEIFKAYFDCRKTKRNTWNALLFEQRLERNVMELYHQLLSGEYQPGRSVMFVVTRPKAREVWAADFRDRVVHHLLYNRYAQTFYNRFIHDSYACIPQKGTLRAAERVQHFMRSITKNHTQPAYFLKADVANFFVSIDKQILDGLLAKHIVDPWWLALTRQILHNNPRKGVYVKSDAHLLAKVPPHKSLLQAPLNKGLPIGNLSSQFFANVYLNELDQYAKHVLKLKHYVRYVDDVIVLDTNGTNLHAAYEKLNAFAVKNLKLNFHPHKKEINRVERGVNFVGYIIKPRCKYLRRSTVNNLYTRTAPLTDFKSLRPTVNSYFGMLRQVNGFRERRRAARVLRTKGCQFDGQLTKLVKVEEAL